MNIIIEQGENLKKQITITVDADTLDTIDNILEGKMIARSKYFNKLMKDDLKNWTNNM